MGIKYIILLMCFDGFAACTHTPPARFIPSFLPPPSLQDRRHGCRRHGHGDDVVTTTTTTASDIAGFCRSPVITRQLHYNHHRRRQRSYRLLVEYHGRHHTDILIENPCKLRCNSRQISKRKASNTFLRLSMESDGITTTNFRDDGNNTTTTNNNNNNKIPYPYNWTSQTVAIAVPSLAGMMTDPLLSLADTLFVGMLGTSVAMNAIAGNAGVAVTSSSSSSVPLAALGACTSIFHLCFHCFRATTSSTSSLVAAALVRDEQTLSENAKKGSGYDVDQGSIIVPEQTQQSEAVLIAQTSIQQSIIMGAFITTFLLVFGPQSLLAMGVSPQGGQSQLYSSAMTYLNYRSIAAPAAVMLSASEGIFRGYGDVITPWKVSCFISLLNLILDPYCMFSGGRGGMQGLGMGIKGAAVATSFSQVGGALLYGQKLFQRGMLGEKNLMDKITHGDLKRRKRGIAMAILRANAAMMAKQGSLLLAWAYATSRATRMGHTVVASHQMALSIWLVVALFLDGAGVAAQVLMAREWEVYKLAQQVEVNNKPSNQAAKEDKRNAIKSLSLYMIKLSLIQGLVGSLAIMLLQQSAPSFIFTRDPAVRQNLLTLLPHVAYQMALVSVTLVTEALAIGGGRFKWLAGGTTVSAVIAMVKLQGAKDLVGIWSGGIVALFVGRLITALLAVMDMNGLFRRREEGFIADV